MNCKKANYLILRVHLASFQKTVAVFLILVISNNVMAQGASTALNSHVTIAHSPVDSLPRSRFLPAQSIILPSAMVVYGLVALKNRGLINLNNSIKEEVYLNHPHNPVTIDNYLQFAPVASVFALNFAGIKSKNNFVDRVMIVTISNIILNTTVQPWKRIFHALRPDSSDHESFPSGHTSEAFANAEFMRMEYAGKYPWLGVAGYIMAGATGYLRMYNNKHWLSDVITGAGIGIVSTKISYWVYPKIKKLVFKGKDTKIMLFPNYKDRSFGVTFINRL